MKSVNVKRNNKKDLNKDKIEYLEIETYDGKTDYRKVIRIQQN